MVKVFNPVSNYIAATNANMHHNSNVYYIPSTFGELVIFMILPVIVGIVVFKTNKDLAEVRDLLLASVSCVLSP